jgi:hypothetical protein
MKTYIVANNVWEAQSYCYDHGVKLNNYIIYVTSPDQLRGIDFNESFLIVLGYLSDRKSFDFTDILNYIWHKYKQRTFFCSLWLTRLGGVSSGEL